MAVTGASGFIGQKVVAQLIEAGWAVRALVRRDAPALEALGATTLQGALEAGPSLARLVEGTSAVVHLAGAIKAPDRRTFVTVNATGTDRLAAAVAASEARPRLLLLSSLAARVPELSPYARSKRMAEERAQARAGGAVDLCIVRPPAVYGPGDRTTLPLFRQLARGLMLVPDTPGARFSLLYVDDLAQLLLRLLEQPVWEGALVEPDDGRDGGYSWAELVEIASRSLGRPVRSIRVPRQLLWVPAALNQVGAGALRRSPALTLGKLRELYHTDWVCRGGSPLSLIDPPGSTQFEQGFSRTMTWYRQHRWL